MFIDSHCHLDRLDLAEFDNNLDNVMQQAKAANVEQMLCVSVTLKEFPSMVEKTSNYDNVNLSCGVHPLNQEDLVDEQELLTLADNDKVVAVGETGLDYFYAPETQDA